MNMRGDGRCWILDGVTGRGIGKSTMGERRSMAQLRRLSV